MSDQPGLPVLTLECGPWRAEVFDPRPDPMALGARYVHGGYVRALWRGQRCLTGNAKGSWDPYVGEGLPEVFELPLAWGSAAEGEEFLRIGAGRLRRAGRGGGSGGLPTTPVRYELLRMDGQSLMMRCRDAIRQGGSTFGYELTREIRLCEQGLDSVSTLRLSVPWNHPVTWFAHPFFAQSGGEATGFVFAGEVVTNGPLTRDSGGAYRLPPQGGLGNVLGLWGDTRPILCRLDEALGGGVVSVQVDRPLDHAVIYASPLASSVEPQLARIWKDGEQASWTIRYRWLG